MPNTPGIVTYLATPYNTTASPSKSVSSTSWNIGDVLVTLAGAEDAITPAVPTNTGSGLSWASVINNSTASTCSTRISIAQATASSSGIVTVGFTDAAKNWGFSLFVINGGKLGGTSAEQHTATKTVALVPKATNSLIIWGCFDFNVEGAVTPNPTVPPVVTRESGTNATHYSLECLV
jgi:hypothetical protein